LGYLILSHQKWVQAETLVHGQSKNNDVSVGGRWKHTKNEQDTSGGQIITEVEHCRFEHRLIDYLRGGQISGV